MFALDLPYIAFIFALKICVLTHVKITLPWKYTFIASILFTRVKFV